MREHYLKKSILEDFINNRKKSNSINRVAFEAFRKGLIHLCSLFIIFLATTLLSDNKCFGQINMGGIFGTVMSYRGDNDSVPFVAIQIYQGGLLKAQTKSNLHGSYRIKGLLPGEYSLKASSVCHGPIELNKILIVGGENYILNIHLPHPHLRNVKLNVGEKSYTNPDAPGQNKLSHEEIIKMPR